MIKLEKGAQYRVVKPGARLHWWEPCGPSCQKGASLKLEVGDIVTYDRNAYGGMSDDVNYDHFRKGSAYGQFWPNNWGACDTDCLEPVTAPVEAT